MIPKEGWKHISCTDLGAINGVCGLCGAKLRFVHRVAHTESNQILDIGCECAAKIIAGAELDYIIDQDKAIRREAMRHKKEMEQYAAYLERCKKAGVEPLTWEQILARNAEYAARKAAEAAKKKRKRRRIV